MNLLIRSYIGFALKLPESPGRAKSPSIRELMEPRNAEEWIVRVCVPGHKQGTLARRWERWRCVDQPLEHIAQLLRTGSLLWRGLAVDAGNLVTSDSVKTKWCNAVKTPGPQIPMRVEIIGGVQFIADLLLDDQPLRGIAAAASRHDRSRRSS